MATNARPPLPTMSMAPDSDAPLLDATCYAVPYGAVGFANSIATLLVVGCLAASRTPLWPRRRLRHNRISMWVCLIWLILCLAMNGVNMMGCVGRYSPPDGDATVKAGLGLVIFGKLMLQMLWSLCVVVHVAKVGTEDDGAATGGDAAADWSGGQAGTGASSGEEGWRGGEDSDIALLEHTRVDTISEPYDPPPPAYESTPPPPPRYTAWLPSLDRTGLQHLTTRLPEFARTSSTQEAAQALSADPPSSSSPPSSRKRKPALPTHLDDGPSVVLWIISSVFVVLVLAGACVLSIDAVLNDSANTPTERKLTVVIPAVILPLIAIGFAGLLIGCAKQWSRDSRAARDGRGEYAGLGRAEADVHLRGGGGKGEATTAHGNADPDIDHGSSVDLTAEATARRGELAQARVADARMTLEAATLVEKRVQARLAVAGTSDDGREAVGSSTVIGHAPAVPEPGSGETLKAKAAARRVELARARLAVAEREAAEAQSDGGDSASARLGKLRPHTPQETAHLGDVTAASAPATSSGRPAGFSAATTTAAAKPSPKRALRLPFAAVPAGAAGAAIALMVMWFADWAVASATANFGGVPTENIDPTQWGAYLIFSKLPVLCI